MLKAFLQAIGVINKPETKPETTEAFGKTWIVETDHKKGIRRHTPIEP